MKAEPIRLIPRMLTARHSALHVAESPKISAGCSPAYSEIRGFNVYPHRITNIVRPYECSFGRVEDDGRLGNDKIRCFNKINPSAFLNVTEIGPTMMI